jgi:hypothetical protein
VEARGLDSEKLAGACSAFVLIHQNVLPRLLKDNWFFRLRGIGITEVVLHSNVDPSRT